VDKLKRDALELEAGKSGRTVSFKPVLYQAIELMMAVLRKLLRTK
jgi:hypothetical protein